ncbi:hypothetical protein RU639_003694 [Aspergillus parasiticus]
MGDSNVCPESIPFKGIMHSGTLEVSNAPITHSWLWPTVGNWLQEGDIVITETGTANFGIWETRSPKGVTAISQVLWGSIGYSLGACLGASLAVRETENRRVILFVGDGSFQMTAQEVSTMIRQELNPIIFTITIFIHGSMLLWFRHLGTNVNTPTAPTKLQPEMSLHRYLHNIHFSYASHFQLVELYMPKDDAPAALKLTAAAAAARNVPMEQ